MNHIVYPNQVAVRVWRNVKTLGKLPTSHFGHASLTLRGPFARGKRMQISFWPGGPGGAGIGLSGVLRQPGDYNDTTLDDKKSEMNPLTAVRLEVAYCRREGIDYPPEWDDWLREFGTTPLTDPRPGQKRLGTVNSDGVPLWSQSQDIKVVLPAYRLDGRFWGLSMSRIVKWWDAFKLQAPHYQALSRQNCAGVALMGLAAGGSEAFVELPSVAIYAEPAQVERYAQMLAVQFDRMEAWSNEFDAEIRTEAAMGRLTNDGTGETKDGLWTLERWKARSALGPLKPRSSTIRAIDDALADFHAADWQAGYKAKWSALVRVFMNVVTHRQNKAQSERSGAVLNLGQQVLALVRNMGPHM